MVPIRQNLVSPERYWLKCPYTMKPTRIVVHNTGNDACAMNEVVYMARNDKEVSFHAAVDDVEIVQGIPFDRNAWHAGDGNGKGNREGISIEICYSKSGGPRFIQAEKNAAEYIASLLKQYGWGMDRVTKHQDYNGKYCPHRTLDMGWEQFLDMVESELDKLNKKEDDEMSYEQFEKYMDRYNAERAKKPIADWAKSGIAKVEDAKVMSRDSGGNFRPQSFITRQEAAVSQAAILRRIEEVADKLDK